MTYKEYVTGRTDEQLLEEFASLEDCINNIQCYGINDLILLEQIGAELRKRGYEAEDSKTLTKWSKK